MRVPEERRRVVYVRIWTFGREEADSLEVLGVVVEVRDEGVGEQETLIT